MSDRLLPDTSLKVGDQLTSANGRFALVMQSYGNRIKDNPLVKDMVAAAVLLS
jgi:hypothetical protein